VIHRRVGRLTKLLEIVIVVTVGMQFRVGFGGSEMHVYRQRVAPAPATKLGCNCLTSQFVGGVVPVINLFQAPHVQDSGSQSE